MRQMPIIVAHYTVHTGYQDEVQNLIRSLMSLGLEFDVVPIKSLGSWRANSNYSVQLIEDMLEKYPGRAVLKTDADAVFRRVPDLFTKDDFDYDFACVWHSFRYKKNELLGGTLYFANTEPAKELIRLWKTKCIAAPRARNPELLDKAVKEMGNRLRVRNLPPRYCKIFDIMRNIKNPVTEHYQASRRFKKTIDADGRRRT